jgi:hypothetical protein
MFRAASILCGVAAAGLLASAGFTAFYPPADLGGAALPKAHASLQDESTGLEVENAERDLGEVPVGDHPVSFRVTNRSDQPGEVVGSTACTAVCCVEVHEQGRVPIPPGATVTVTSKLRIRRPGPFEFGGSCSSRTAGACAPSV